MGHRSKLLRVTASSAAIMLLTAGCGGSGGGSVSSNGNSTSGNSSGGNGGSPTYTVGGTVTGLGASAGLVLVNGGDTLSVAADAASFTMPTSVGNGQGYDVTVKVHPAALDCSVASGAGTVNGADVTSVSVTCKAATVSLVHSFAGGTTDGANPWGNLIQASDGNLYGVASAGGANSHGVIFKMTPGGSESVFYSFAGGTSDGAYPEGGLIQAGDGSLYGTTAEGGASGNGVIYKITLDGTESVVYSFAGGATAGADAMGGVLQANDGNFYGMALVGGTSNSGVVFKVTPGGTETVLASMGIPSGGAGLIQGSDGNLYGMDSGGASGRGAFFRMALSGSMSTLYSFQGGTTDGVLPVGTPIQASDGNFYGATAGGGTYNIGGTIFKITSGGTETILYSFGAGNTDGEQPESSPIQANDGNLYGVTEYGGANNDGIVYRLTLSGAETVLYSFAGGATDGSNPDFNLVQASDGTLYGVTPSGGASGNGTIFKIN